MGVAVAALWACGEPRDVGSDSGRAVARRDTVIIDGTAPTCARCVLDVMQPLRLGRADDPEIPQRVPEVIRDGRGTHLLVFNGWSNKPILRYDSLGRLLGKLGRYGQGPGEYTMSMRVHVGPQDSVFVFTGERRAQVYDPGGAYARTVVMERADVFAVAGDGSGAMLAMSSPSFEAYGNQPYVIRLAPDGTRLDSFPIFAPAVAPSRIRSGTRERLTVRRMEAAPALGPDGAVWMVGEHNYRLERHDPSGSSRQVIGVALPASGLLMTETQAESLAATRPVPGSMPRQPLRGPPPGISPYKMKTSVSVDSAGRLWVLRIVPAPRYDTITVNAHYLSPDEAPGEATIPREVEDRLYHTVVDVIDPRGPELLARTELPFLGHAAAPGFIARVTQDEDGHFVSLVYPLRLRMP